MKHVLQYFTGSSVSTPMAEAPFKITIMIILCSMTTYALALDAAR